MTYYLLRRRRHILIPCYCCIVVVVAPAPVHMTHRCYYYLVFAATARTASTTAAVFVTVLLVALSNIPSQVGNFINRFCPVPTTVMLPDGGYICLGDTKDFSRSLSLDTNKLLLPKSNFALQQQKNYFCQVLGSCSNGDFSTLHGCRGDPATLQWSHDIRG